MTGSSVEGGSLSRVTASPNAESGTSNCYCTNSNGPDATSRAVRVLCVLNLCGVALTFPLGDREGLRAMGRASLAGPWRAGRGSSEQGREQAHGWRSPYPGTRAGSRSGRVGARRAEVGAVLAVFLASELWAVRNLVPALNLRRDGKVDRLNLLAWARLTAAALVLILTVVGFLAGRARP